MNQDLSLSHSDAVKADGLKARLGRWARRVELGRKMAIALTIAALASGTGTFITLTGASAVTPDPITVIAFLALDLVLVLALGVLVARRLLGVWGAGRKGGAGSRLHFRLVGLFSLVALTPAVLVAVFAVLYFNLGIEAWFNPRVRTALDESRAVAGAYLKEHQQSLASEVQAMANDLAHETSRFVINPVRLVEMVRAQTRLRGLSEAVVFDGSGRIVARSGFAYSLQFGEIPFGALDRAQQGEVVLLSAAGDDQVRALTRLPGGFDFYLFVGRFVDPKVIGHLERTNKAVLEYETLSGRRTGIQTTFSLVFAVVTLLLFVVAIWVGLTVANQLVHPITLLIDAAERIRGGDLATRVDEAGVGNELGSLARAFNRMTSQLESQRRELIDTNRALDERRRFTETVLSGVSAGVVGLDAEGCVHLPNRRASELLGFDLDRELGRPLGVVVAAMDDLVQTVKRRPDRVAQGEIQIDREGQPRTLLVRVAAERLETEVVGYVVTFDDVTDLLSAQRKAAWADVARRIAHEIKNPLTPIQLSAERLKRKYLKEVQSEPDVFATCTDTIVRQVGEIGRMVDEFSDFARMPQAVFCDENLTEIVAQAVFLQRNSHSAIRYETQMPEGSFRFPCDGRQVSRALTNLLKNAAEAIEGRDASAAPGWIAVRLSAQDGGALLVVEDNGKGLPKEERHRLTEPYVTTRSKGTGLGLAIVKKIMEDHGGDLRLEDLDGAGARVSLVFPAREPLVQPSIGEVLHGA